MSKVEIIYNGFTLADIPEGQTGRLACRGKKMVSDVTIEYKSTGVNKLAQVADNTVTEITASDLKGAMSIGNSTFADCRRLTSVEIPDSVTSIGNSAFMACSALPSIVIPDSVTFIGGSCFHYCDVLKSVVIGSGITTIAYSAFNTCYRLQVVDFSKAKVVPTLDNVNAFNGVPTTCKIVIPDSLYDSWKSATNWSALTQTFVKASEYTGG